MLWIDNLKIAIIEKDLNAIQNIINNMPKIDNIDKAKEALALVKEAISIVEKEKKKTLEIMNKIKQTKAFLNSH